MSMNLTGITNKNEYYTNHYLSTMFEDNAADMISRWNSEARETEEAHTPWSQLRQAARQYYVAHDRFVRSSVNMQTLANIRSMADLYLKAIGYPEAKPASVEVDEALSVPVYLEMTKNNGAPLLWVILAASKETDVGILESHVFNAKDVTDDYISLPNGILSDIPNEELVTKILFGSAEPPRFVMLIGMNQIALIDRNKWNEKRYLQFEMEEIFARLENSTLQAMAVLLHRESLCPDDGKVFLDELDEQSQRHASGVSQDLKYALRESIELLGNEVIYDMKTRQGLDLEADPIDAGELTLECLRYMYRMLFVLFIESRPELGYAPIKSQSYYTGYSLESLRDIADDIREDVSEVGGGYYLHETLEKLYTLIYNGYPSSEDELKKAESSESLHDMFLIAPLKAHIFDPEFTQMINQSKLRNSCMLRIIDLMSLTRTTGRRSDRRGRISYANLGINQLGAVYEALLSYRGFIAEQDLYEVKKAGDSFNELEVGYFVPESELDQYTEEERVRYEEGDNKGKLRMYEKGTFIYRLAGREREKSASYYTPEVLTKCLVKYALKELLDGKTADEILELTICEPAMGSAAFLNEAINQLAEAYISLKEKETGEVIGYEDRFDELQKVKMYIADRNVYGIDLNPVAVELAEVSLWLNTIYEGGYVPWFGTQLVNGNSLIGARRQVYRIENATATSKGLRWYEMEPERLPIGTVRADKGYQFGRKQIYHFLLGDPGMCSYSDKVIKSMEPEKIKSMAQWNKKFIEPINDDEIITLLRLSETIDKLWEAQIQLRKEVEERTRDTLSVFGHVDDAEDSHTTIRQKDLIYNELYKSENMQNAGPYARLKFAMDYWCALWFWPIEKADLLPTRSEFLFDMSLILEGTTSAVVVTDATSDKKQVRGQLSLFPTEMQQLEQDILDLYKGMGEVDIPALRRSNPRLDLAANIAEQNKFMHWELEFADLFAERGGFDLILGNPPWIKVSWNEKNVLSDSNPMFAVKNLTATETSLRRTEALKNKTTSLIYFDEYESIIGQQNFLNAIQNYAKLSGMKVNLYKCFLPQTWNFINILGVTAFVHPEGIYEDPKGGLLREDLFNRLRFHFQFENEFNLFEGTNDHGRMRFGLNIYGKKDTIEFDSISNLFTAFTVDECYSNCPDSEVPGVKDENGNWNTKGHPDRIIHISSKELQIFAKLFDDNDNWKQAKLPAIHCKELVAVLETFSIQEETFASLNESIYSSQMWNETIAQKDGTIRRNIHFPENTVDTIYSGPHIGVANPLFKSSRRECKVNSDYDIIDLTEISSNMLQRVNYSPASNLSVYWKKIPIDYNGKPTNLKYRLIARKMLNLSGERTLIAAIVPPKTSHINGIIGFEFNDDMTLLLCAGLFASIPYDFFIKIVGKTNLYTDNTNPLPIINNVYAKEIRAHALILNCLTENYKMLWEMSCQKENIEIVYYKRIKNSNNREVVDLLNTPMINSSLRTDWDRRQALVELDVLSAMALGMSLQQLKTIYRIQFPVLQQYEADTWYDANGRIVFTSNKGLGGVGYDRATWETQLKGAPAGQKFYRTITDDTMPGGPVERTIEYVAPFDRCEREQDYETAWKFFEEKYGTNN